MGTLGNAHGPDTAFKNKMIDCLVIGGGPAGLTAAIYLARFHLSTVVVDAGHSRARTIPLTRNHAGFPDGISGEDLLARMRLQAGHYGARLIDGTVETLSRQDDETFAARLTESSTLQARTVLIATGVVNRRPSMIDDRTHDLALSGGQLRYCPVCDGYEVTDRRVAVMGTGEHACEEALFLRSYTRHVTVIAPQSHDLSDQQRKALTEAGIAFVEGCRTVWLDDRTIVLEGRDGAMVFDSLYPALGSDVRSELAGQLSAHRSDEGCLLVDAHQRTSVPGLYAAGDVVLGLDQISHAMGEGGVAATTIRNDLARQTPLLR